jgi:nitrite reductase/ring-hydroxylating ferredoxin subunit
LNESPAIAGTLLCRLDAIADNGCVDIQLGSPQKPWRVMVLRRGAEAWAYHNSCPHFSLPLNAQADHFLIVGAGRVMCAFHCAVFRFEDGACIEGPARGLSLERVPIDVSDGEVRLA